MGMHGAVPTTVVWIVETLVSVHCVHPVAVRRERVDTRTSTILLLTWLLDLRTY